MRRALCSLVCLFLLPLSFASAEIFGRVQGVVHDPQHRPISGALVTLTHARSQAARTTTSDTAGTFLFPAVPLGDYTVTVSSTGFHPLATSFSLVSDVSPLLHFELQVAPHNQSVTVEANQASSANVESVTPTTSVSQIEIARTPGADRTNSLQMITDFVPGASITHDMLHMRGGHQVSWQIDGVQIPNTNIGSNLGAQIDPKDIDYLETERGSYNADNGDRTYGVFNIVPRTGFDRNRQAELVTSFGGFLQTNDQLNLGDHTDTFAYYASVNGNRSDYGLSPPTVAIHHDAANGFGGFSSLIYNRTPKDQLRLVTQLRSDYFQIPYDPNPQSPENLQYDSSHLRDAQHERDGLAAFTWAHTYGASLVLQLSPFYHYNSIDYAPGPVDLPVATSSYRSSQYAGLQTSLTGQIARNTFKAGLYSFGQDDHYLFGSSFNDGSAQNFRTTNSASGGLIEEYVSDSFRPAPWITLIAGLRQSHFIGSFTEDATSPRIGLALQVPKLNWVFRGFYGRFYQPPPLLSVSGPIAVYATSQNTAFQPLHGERDEEHQFGVQIPLRGWLLDADTFETRARNFLDHSNLGESSIYFPVSINGALIQGWELTLASPHAWRFGQVHLAYSNQLAHQRGALTGGLVCAPVSSTECSSGFAYTPLDHDQRNTLSVGYSTSLPAHFTASTDISYGSGFYNGSPNAIYPGSYLPQHTSIDFAASHTIREDTSLSVNVLNAANQRVLLDNSLTFGGFHFSDPREVYGELRFRFHY